MDYMILTVKCKVRATCGEVEVINYICANSIARCKNSQGQDVLQFVSSGVGQQIPMESVIAITASTPSSAAVAALRG
jgi:hypothetical protein